MKLLYVYYVDYVVSLVFSQSRVCMYLHSRAGSEPKTHPAVADASHADPSTQPRSR